METGGSAPALHTFVADLHVHTVLSPCAAVEMIPPLIVREALAHGIDLIAITDHNASANVRAVQRAATGTGLVVLPGMELQTYEEIHLLCIFGSLAQLESWQEMVDAHLPPRENVPNILGEQFVVDETGEFVGRERRLLATSTDIRLKEAVEEITRRGGLAIPAHVDRPVYSLLANLGFVPRDVPFHALEISPHTTPAAARDRLSELVDTPLIQSGDVHHLDGFASTTVFNMARPTLSEIKLALQGKQGRTVAIRRPLQAHKATATAAV